MKKFVLLLSLCFLVFPYPSHADDGWLSLGQFKSEVSKVRADGKRLSRIFCRKTGNVTVFKYKTHKNRGNREWVWAYGYSLLNKDLELRKKGFYKFTSDANERPARVQCAVWYKRR